MLSLDSSRCLPMKWRQSVTAGRRRTSTLLLHFFNQREKKSLILACLSAAPCHDATTAQPTLSPLRCNRQIKKKKRIPPPANPEERRRSLALTASRPQRSPTSFSSLSLPIVHFLHWFFFFLPPFMKPVKKPPILINFSLLIFVCISCFVLLDVLIRPVFGPRFCFAKQFPLQEGNELKSRWNISLACGDSKEATCQP